MNVTTDFNSNQSTQTAMNPTTDFNSPQVDPFVSDEFIDKNASLPTVIVLNDQQHCGYFIPVSTMARCGWVSFDETQLVEHTFRSGTTEPGVLIQNPRLLCCPKTELYQYDLQASSQQRTRVTVGLYDAALKDDPNIKTERLYLGLCRKDLLETNDLYRSHFSMQQFQRLIQ
ncbi:hypothetical protein H6G17_32200 [Chroococcidiopsis sp. FACHB-1243]|uniref:DUF5895 domain-containing protein n=1 Tax=Chroococcidiopsis sp. [FACHB-1243] TaxID=2692781 RepID=UPI001781C733|nr:DUF5895 domain-containing protein [Chroococcidiopsis sp. [FACHB-1243]]MBD2310054.1 hypothetical protein [Chroococcidiopsis sp. [FACHB-1243]]